MSTADQKPGFPAERVQALLKDLYGLTAVVSPLPGERDQSFRAVTTAGQTYVLKIANPAEAPANLEFQNQVMQRLEARAPALAVPRLVPALSGAAMTAVPNAAGAACQVRLLTYLPGQMMVEAQPHSSRLLHALGRFLGEFDLALDGFDHLQAHRPFLWSIKEAGPVIHRYLAHVADSSRRTLVDYFLLQFEQRVLPALAGLRQGIIHNDANDYNVLVDRDGAGEWIISGLIDFGDMLHGPLVYDLAVAVAYAMLGKEEPLAAAAEVVRGYNTVLPLEDGELDQLFLLICMRLCTSVAVSAYQQKLRPDDPYLVVSERPAWELLERLVGYDPDAASALFRQVCGQGQPVSDLRSRHETLSLRRERLGPSLSISYQEPLKIVRGFGQYLYDENGRRYLDAVNNVPHVGHGHPRVVRAAQRQAALLNTNTRYLHDLILDYAQRLCVTMPEPLSVCFFVNSGSEANELALRLARTYTGAEEFLVVDGAYHGNTAALIDISPYKFNGPGGRGAPDHVHVLPMPDRYRGAYGYGDPGAGVKYAAFVEHILDRLRSDGRSPAAFIAESVLGCGGQVVLPNGYLAEAYRLVRAAGGVTIADEVQVGFGRVGSHMWAFETQGVTPDIVTLGKPMGNGHPLAAVVTTPAIAASFNNGMEYFNTFGGNPVSCAVGLAVLDVLADEGLQENARLVGERLKAGLVTLMDKHPLIGDVRGLGLFIGAELVQDRDTLEPAAEEAAAIVNAMKERGILLSTDGPLHNVIKIKPPLVFNAENADFLVQTLDEIMTDHCPKPV